MADPSIPDPAWPEQAHNIRAALMQAGKISLAVALMREHWNISADDFQDTWKACVHTFTAGRNSWNQRTSEEDAMSCWDDWSDQLEPYLNVLEDVPNDTTNLYERAQELFENTLEFTMRFVQANNGRVFFITQDRYMGLAPIGCEAGDRICVIRGGSVPFVIQKHDDGWLLMGECYVRGLMDGEAIQMDEIEMQDITLV